MRGREAGRDVRGSQEAASCGRTVLGEESGILGASPPWLLITMRPPATDFAFLRVSSLSAHARGLLRGQGDIIDVTVYQVLSECQELF